MARSKNGKLIGAARATEKREIRHELAELAHQDWVKNLHPEALYWRRRALYAWDRLVELVGPGEAELRTGDWDDGRTWKELANHTEQLWEAAMKGN